MNRQYPKGASLVPNAVYNIHEVDPNERTLCRPYASVADDARGRDSYSDYHSAVALLQEHDDVKILAWVQLLRSLTPDFEHTTRSSHLSAQQLDAVATLRECPDQTVTALLQSIRRGTSQASSTDKRKD